MKIATFNIDQARREEQITDEQVAVGEFDTRFNNRCSLIMNLINNCGADIVCLQELRSLSTSKYDIKTFLSLLNYDYQYMYYSELEDSFALAILYDRKKFHPVDMNSFNLHNINNNKICFGIKFKNISTKEIFWVWTTHWAIEENLKWDAAYKITGMLGECSEPLIICGDYNLFDDMDGNKQREWLLDYFTDQAFPLENLSGTFYGYNVDKGKKEISKMSRLDHMFSRNMIKTTNAVAIGVTQELLEKRSYPSDHLMIMVEVEIKDIKKQQEEAEAFYEAQKLAFAQINQTKTEIINKIDEPNPCAHVFY